MLLELVVDVLDLGLLHRGGSGSLRDLLESWACLSERQRRAAATQLGLDGLQFGLRILEFIDRARAPFYETSEPREAAAGIRQTCLKARHDGPGLFDFLGPRARFELCQHLPTAVEFGDRAFAFDLEQTAEQLGDRFIFNDMLTIENREFDKPPVHGAADVARSRGQHGADERLPRGCVHRHNSGHDDRHRRLGHRCRRQKNRQKSCRGSKKCFADPCRSLHNQSLYL